MAPIYINTLEELDERLSASSVPAIVDFSVSRCTPCKDIIETMERLANEKDDINVFIVETGADTAKKYDIKGFPTIALFIDGIEKRRRIGMLTLRAIKDMITE